MELTTLLLVAVIGLIFYYSSRKPDNYPPGPSRLPLIGTLWRTHWDIRLSMMERHLKMRNVYGKIIGYYLLGHPSVMINDYEIAREVLNKAAASGRPHLEYTKLRTHGKLRGVLLNEGPVWSAQRRFALHHLRDLGMGKSSLEDVVQHQVTQLLSRLNCLEPGQTVAVNSFFNVHVLNVLWEIVTGKQFKHDDSGIQIIMRALQSFLRSSSDLSGIVKTFAGAVWRPLGGDLYAGVVTARDELVQLFRTQIEEHRATLDVTAPRDFLDHFLIRSDLEGNKSGAFDEWELYALLQDLFLAGSETTSTTAEWAMLYMLCHRDVQARVQAELDSVVGAGQRVEMRHRCQLPYTEAVLAETMRRSAALPQAVPHRAMEDIQVAGYTIPKDTWISMNVNAIHYDERHWGDPEVFRPERFISEGKFVADKHLVPFGIGKRVCMGESLARQESFLFVANVLHSFEVRPPGGQKPPQVLASTGLVIAPVPFKVQFVKRH